MNWRRNTEARFRVASRRSANSWKSCVQVSTHRVQDVKRVRPAHFVRLNGKHLCILLEAGMLF